MAYAIGDAVRLRDGSDRAELLGPAADATGIVGDAWTDSSGERISVVYEEVQLYAWGLPAAEFVRDRPLDAAPF